MNIKAAYYAFSRMLLPTITVIGLILLSTLSIDTTFGFLMQKTWLSGLLRVALLAVELIWFYYLYEKKIEELYIESIAKGEEITDLKKLKDGSLSSLEDYLASKTSHGYAHKVDTVVYKVINPKLFIVKLIQ